MFLNRPWRAGPSLTTVLFAGGLVFAAGYAAGGGWSPLPQRWANMAASPPILRSAAGEPPATPAAGPGYPAELLHVNDGDTFEARVRIWPGMAATTRVRLRGIDAPKKFGARCASEYRRAVVAEEELRRLLAAGGIVISRVGVDKYGGRVLADAATRDVANVSDAMLKSGLARRYDGGRRGRWCDEAKR